MKLTIGILCVTMPALVLADIPARGVPRCSTPSPIETENRSGSYEMFWRDEWFCGLALEESDGTRK